MRPIWTPRTRMVELYWRCGSYGGNVSALTSMDHPRMVVGQPTACGNKRLQNWGPTTYYFWKRVKTMSWRPCNRTDWPC